MRSRRPGVLDADGNALYLKGESTAHTEPGGTVELRVQRLEDGRGMVGTSLARSGGRYAPERGGVR